MTWRPFSLLFTLTLAFGVSAAYSVNATQDDPIAEKTNIAPGFGREYTIIEGERILMPLKVPKLTWKDKERLILASGQSLTEINERRRKRRHKDAIKISGQKVRRALQSRNNRQYNQPKPVFYPLMAKNAHKCPKIIDAATQGHNKRTYVFSGDFVYQIFQDKSGLQQKSAFLISDLFPNGPRRVSAALTNLKSSVTVLINQGLVYRFRWHKKHQRFILAHKSPQHLDRNITFTPKHAFQWFDGNMVLTDGQRFATYDPYWNVATFVGKISDYFPAVPFNSVGLVYSSPGALVWLSKYASVMVYNTKKYRIEQEYPMRIPDYIACLAND